MQHDPFQLGDQHTRTVAYPEPLWRSNCASEPAGCHALQAASYEERLNGPAPCPPGPCPPPLQMVLEAFSHTRRYIDDLAQITLATAKFVGQFLYTNQVSEHGIHGIYPSTFRWYTAFLLILLVILSVLVHHAGAHVPWPGPRSFFFFFFFSFFFSGTVLDS